jgi:bacterial/archaeal transporter family-2 protein
MHPALMVPFALGLLAVVQVGLNRRIAAAIGLMPATILNAGVLLAVAVVLFLYARGLRPQAGEWTSGAGAFGEFGWWWLVPGLCGLALVAGMPWAVKRIGALQLFVALVAAQMVFSLAWDHFVEHVAVTTPRVIGAALAIAGAFVTTIRT